MDETNIAVIGAGLAGAAAARSLARAGHDVALLERTTPANAQGSSHGSARIFRYGYPDPFYTSLVQRSAAMWDELAAEHGAPLIRPTGSIDHGSRRDPESLARVLDAAGVEHELLSAGAAEERWPQFRFATPVLFHPAAGVIDAETSVRALVASAVGAGARLETDWALDAVERSGDGFVLHASTGARLRAREVVVAAGGWLPRLLDRLPVADALRAALPPFEVRQEQAYHFPYDESVASGADWPTFIHKADDIQTYSLPGGRDADDRGQKLAEYCVGRPLASAEDQDGVVDAVNRERVVAYVREHLPGLVPEPYAETTCLFTSTPDEDFVIHRADGVTILSPCSGHGAKFAPLLGELVVDAVTGRAAVPDRFRVALPEAVSA